MEHKHFDVEGSRGKIVAHAWYDARPRYIALLAHGYGEHAHRYWHVAERLVANGAAVFAPDHFGHGESDGERALLTDLDAAIEDFHRVSETVRRWHPECPIVLIGHSMGGAIAARYAQVHAAELSALVLSGPAIGENPAYTGLLEMNPIPEIPIDPAVLSRDPAVGEAYASDPQVYHGPFLRETLETFRAAVTTIADGGTLNVPTLWIHGEEDMLIPLELTRPAIERIRGGDFAERIYPGALHEVFNETNKDEVIGDVVEFIRGKLA